MITESLSSAGKLLLPRDLDWTLVFASFPSRYPSDTDNQIFAKPEFEILFYWFWFYHCFIPDLPLNFTMCSSILCPLSFNSTSKNFEFGWSVTGLILKALSSFLLSWKCWFWMRTVSNHCVLNIYSPVFSNRGLLTDGHNEVYSKRRFQFFLGNCETSSILISFVV